MSYFFFSVKVASCVPKSISMRANAHETVHRKRLQSGTLTGSSNKLYKQFLSSRSNDKVKYIQNIQKLVNGTIKNCQKQYYEALLTKNKSNIKATCSMNRAKCKSI